MFQLKRKSILFALFGVLFVQFSYSQEEMSDKDQQILDDGIRILRNYFLPGGNWQTTRPETGAEVNGLLHFLEKQPIDSILTGLKSARQDSLFVYRSPQQVEDSLQVPGYVSAEEAQIQMEKIRADYQEEVNRNPIPVPEWIIADARKNAPVIPEGKGMVLFADSLYRFPPELIIPDVIPDSVLNSPEAFRRLVQIDSLRSAYVENQRLIYNDSVTNVYIKQRSADYRKQLFEDQLRFRQNRYAEELSMNNYRVLKAYNDHVMALVNDSIRAAIEVLSAYADFIDTTTVTLSNLSGNKSSLLLQSGRERYSRIWLKNEQQDSMQVLVKSTGKRDMQFLINDGVTFSRFTQKQTKTFDFETLKVDHRRFSDVGKSYELETPWVIGGDGNAGFTQTYFENWKKGGESALSMLMVLKGFANYSSHDKKRTWENNAEIRNGWMKPGSGSELRKNDDKLEITSKFGLSAYKKWYYSTELNFNTQFFRGYKYPKANNPTPISAFLAPSKTVFKIGMDYKPDKNFSLLLSPISLKNVFVRDTALIDQTKYGVNANRRAFWEVGLNADLKMKHQFNPNISLETKYKMFINYRDPFKKLDIDLENQLRVQLTTYMDLRLMIHLLYDDNILFPVYNDAGDQIGEKAKLQVEEFFTIGFTYKINKKVMRTKKLR